MNTRLQILGAWSCPAFIIILLPAFFTMGFLPPLAATMTPEALATHFVEHNGAIRFGSTLMIQMSMLGIVWAAVISAQMRKIECESAPFLTYAQLALGTMVYVVFVLSAEAWLIASYRPDRNAELVFLLNDYGWLCLFLSVGPLIFQSLTIGFAILNDTSANPVYPRWAGFLNLWCCVLYLPGAIANFFYSGPFYWGGIFAFWIPLNVFVAWIFVMSYLTHRAIKRQASRQVALSLAA